MFFCFFLFFFLGGAPGTAHRRLVQSAVEGNFNMLRVWGQGIWEPRAFHDACDEMGVLLLTDSQIEPMYVRVCNTFFYFDGRPPVLGLTDRAHVLPQRQFSTSFLAIVSLLFGPGSFWVPSHILRAP